MRIRGEKPALLADLRPGNSIVFEFGGFLFVAVIDDTSRLDEKDQMLLTIYAASDSQFSGSLPTQLWLNCVSQYVSQRRMHWPNPDEHAALASAMQAQNAHHQIPA